MGSHYVGEVFAAGIQSVLLFKKIDEVSNEEALAVFDMLGNMCVDTDAEFDDLFEPDSDAYKMLCKAFFPEILVKFLKTPDENLQSEKFIEWDKMFTECNRRFKEKYSMC